MVYSRPGGYSPSTHASAILWPMSTARVAFASFLSPEESFLNSAGDSSGKYSKPLSSEDSSASLQARSADSPSSTVDCAFRACRADARQSMIFTLLSRR